MYVPYKEKYRKERESKQIRMDDKNNSFERNGLILFVLTMSANFCNYLFQILSAKILNDVDLYGEINVLISVLTMLLVVNTILVMVTSKFIASDIKNGKIEHKSDIMACAKRLSYRMMAILLLLGCVLAPFFSKYLDIETIKLICIVIIATFMIASAPYVGFLQGKQLFVQFGIQNLLNMLCKLLISICLIAMGIKVYGVLIALFLGEFAVYVYCYVYAHPKETKPSITYDIYVNMKKYLIQVLGFQICITFITNFDLLIIKGYFSARDAGLYSSAMVIGKIPLYIANIVVNTMFPMAASCEDDTNRMQELLKKTVIYGTGMAAVCSAILVVFKDFIIRIFYGSNYEKAATFLLPIALYVVPLTLVTIVTNFSIAVGKTKIVNLILGIDCVLVLAVTKIFHSTISQVLCQIGGLLLISFFVIRIYLYKIIKKGKTV